MTWFFLGILADTFSTPVRVGLWLLRLALLAVSGIYLLVAAGIHSQSGLWQGLFFLAVALVITVVLRVLDSALMWIRIQRVRRKPL